VKFLSLLIRGSFWQKYHKTLIFYMMIEFELNRPYSTKEVAAVIGITYDSFRHAKERYEKKFNEGYKWEYVKRKYIFYEKIGNVYKLQSEQYYNEIYLPKVIEVIKKKPWNTGAGVVNEIWTEEVMNQVQHAMERAYDYVCKVLGNEYNITERKYAACMGQGVYARFMTDEEIDEWNELKSKCSKDSGKIIMELTEQWVNGIIKTSEYNKRVKGLASGAFLNALGEWIADKGFIPVMLKHYERKNEIEMKKDGFLWIEDK